MAHFSIFSVITVFHELFPQILILFNSLYLGLPIKCWLSAGLLAFGAVCHGLLLLPWPSASLTTIITALVALAIAGILSSWMIVYFMCCTYYMYMGIMFYYGSLYVLMCEMDIATTVIVDPLVCGLLKHP